MRWSIAPTDEFVEFVAVWIPLPPDCRRDALPFDVRCLRVLRKSHGDRNVTDILAVTLLIGIEQCDKESGDCCLWINSYPWH
jgi:hypothetical protein